MITPSEYFRHYPHACRDAQAFCFRFSTMRDAWLDERVDVEWMLWALKHDCGNCERLNTFIRDITGLLEGYPDGLADSVLNGAEQACDNMAVGRLFVLATDISDMHAGRSDVVPHHFRQSRLALQRSKLMELFPEQFKEESVTKGPFQSVRDRYRCYEVHWDCVTSMKILDHTPLL